MYQYTSDSADKSVIEECDSRFDHNYKVIYDFRFNDDVDWLEAADWIINNTLFDARVEVAWLIPRCLFIGFKSIDDSLIFRIKFAHSHLINRIR